MAGEAKRDYPASINYQSPWYKKYSCVEDHFARVNTAMTRGVPIVKVGVIHPVESFWLHWGPNDKSGLIREELDKNFQDLTKWLLFGSIDFDFISESLLPGLCPSADAPLRVGEMKYDVIVVPGCETLRSSTLERLEKFKADGGRVIFLGEAPTLENAQPSDRGERLFKNSEHIPYQRASLLTALDSERSVCIRDEDGYLSDGLIYQLREDTDSLWLFVAHAEDSYDCDLAFYDDIKITVKGEYSPVIYDTLSGELKPAQFDYLNGNTVISARLYEYDSLLLRLYDGCSEGQYTEPEEREDKKFTVPCETEYELDEPNVMLLDMARFALDGDELSGEEEELLRADNICREKLGFPLRSGAVMQPWVIHEPVPEHKIKLRFTIDSALALDGVSLALEDAEKAQITLNGQAVDNTVTGWYVDRAVKTVALPRIAQGENILEIVLPFGKRTNVEWCYLLGDFGVEVRGRLKKLIKRPDKLAFGSIVNQGLPFYGGCVTYRFGVDCPGGDIKITVPHYDGALTDIFVDGVHAGEIIFPPYELELKELSAGRHEIEVKLYTNRRNAFGTVHLYDKKCHWIGPDAWRTSGCQWSYEYVLRNVGVESAPVIYSLKK